MKTYARVENGVVVELIASAVDPGKSFHPSFQWVEAPPDVTENFLFDGKCFTGPSPPPIVSSPTLVDLQVRLAALTAEIATLSRTS